jgi:hypothetical protein
VKASAPIPAPFMKARRAMSSMASSPERREQRHLVRPAEAAGAAILWATGKGQDGRRLFWNSSKSERRFWA